MSVNYRDPSTGNLIRLDGYTIDSVPTQNSGKPVSSGGVYEALQNVGSADFVGKVAEWNALTPEQKVQYEIVNIIDDNATTMLSPVTPVNTGAATPVELEDYIESVAGGGGAGAWTNLGSYENCLNSTTNKNAYLQPMQNFMASSSYSEIMIVINPHGILIHSAITLPASLFKDIPSGGGERWFNIPCGNSALDTWTSNVAISNVQEEDESYSFKTYSNNTGSYSAFDVLFYGR